MFERSPNLITEKVFINLLGRDLISVERNLRIIRQVKPAEPKRPSHFSQLILSVNLLIYFYLDRI